MGIGHVDIGKCGCEQVLGQRWEGEGGQERRRGGGLADLGGQAAQGVGPGGQRPGAGTLPVCLDLACPPLPRGVDAGYRHGHGRIIQRPHCRDPAPGDRVRQLRGCPDDSIRRNSYYCRAEHAMTHTILFPPMCATTGFATVLRSSLQSAYTLF